MVSNHTSGGDVMEEGGFADSPLAAEGQAAPGQVVQLVKHPVDFVVATDEFGRLDRRAAIAKRIGLGIVSTPDR